MYIEREALLKAARKNKAIGLCEADIVDVQDLINSQPAADVRYVIHSTWEITDVDHAHGHKCYHCPECGTDEWRYDSTNYCPNCGAKMDGGKENEKPV